ncbi:unnamed protein product, partial [marine sediment metagenome]
MGNFVDNLRKNNNLIISLVDPYNIALKLQHYPINILVLQQAIYLGKGFDCYPAFNSDDPDLPHKAFNTMMKFTPDLVHIQHEYGLFGEQGGMNIIPLSYKFKLSQIPTVITLHTVPKKCNYEDKIIEKALVEITDATIVHEHYQRELIIGRVGYQDKVWVIPHGVRQIKPASNAKEKLGLMDKKVVLLAGYFRRSKNFERVVRVFPKVIKAVDDV